MLNSVAKPELIVSTVDLLRPASIFFKSWRARRDPSYNFALKDMARATSAAETYFAPARSRARRATPIAASTAVPRSTTRRLPRSSRPTSCGTARICACFRSAPARGPSRSRREWWHYRLAAQISFRCSWMRRPACSTIWPGGPCPGTLVRCDIALGPGVNTAFDDASPANLAALAALGGNS